MDFSHIVQELEKASSFDLFRLSSAIDMMLEEPLRMARIKQQLIVGREVEYFDPKTNQLFNAVIVDVRRTRVIVKHVDDGSRWGLPFYYINLNHVDTTIESNVATGLTRNEIHIGEQLGFSHEGADVYGTVLRLNPKTVSISTPGTKWRIPYALLFKVIDGQSSAPDMKLTLDGELDLKPRE